MLRLKLAPLAIAHLFVILLLVDAGIVLAQTHEHKPRPGKVLAAATDDSIVVSLGAAQGLKVGDQLEVLRLIEIRDSTGTVVFAEEKPVGILTVTQLQQDRSKTARLSGDAVEEGFIVRKPR